MQHDTALLVIDVQTGMFDAADPVYDGERLLSNIGRLLEKARTAGVPVIFIQHNESAGGILINGTPAWEIHRAIAPQPRECVIQKRTPDSFHQTSLQQELAARGIRKLILTGIQSEVCVDTTCRRAFSLGYDTTLVQDAHSTWSAPEWTADQIILHHNRTLRWFADVKPTQEIKFS